ncbi:UpxY family transcription antiterminator [Cesiribacter sp. SM1]|uniref:UpxY family transcription antiterminator n=1 Tax=Cesiribacter sp. SM1 TaxID=2861196 RepID=UPI001CD81676|nr:UpxY family transcription antiterminator [Cesiribacter sp. SM1]
MNTFFKQNPNWYAVYTRSRAEKKLQALLTQKKVECFLPLKKTASQRTDRKKIIELPLIPSYLFVRITEKEHYEVLNTQGAVCYVKFDGQPAAIPDEQINSLKQLMMTKPQDLTVQYDNFSRGDIVQVCSGPLKGIIAEVVQIRGKDRLLLRFESLGYCVHVELTVEELTACRDLAVC